MEYKDPPYDDSKPCPMCPVSVRSASAGVHNFLVRWPHRDAIRQLYDLAQRALPDVKMLGIEDPALVEFLKQAEELRSLALRIQLMENKYLQWSPETLEAIVALEPTVRIAATAIEKLSAAHFHDARHSLGKPNVLRSIRGTAGSLDGSHTDYNHWVEFAHRGMGNIDYVHEPCGIGLRIHPVFREQIAKDPTFYGLVFCDICAVNSAFENFKRWVPPS